MLQSRVVLDSTSDCLHASMLNIRLNVIVNKLYLDLNAIRSYGVLLWEVVTFGELPLKKMEPEDIIKMADNKTLFHSRYVNH